MIEIIPKPAQKLPLWLNILFYFSIAFLLGMVSTYFILDHSLKSSKNSLKILEETLTQEKTGEEVVLEKEVFGYQKKIQDFSKLLSQHQFCSKLFEFIEGICHPKIWFSQINLNPAQSEVNLLGEAEDFTTIGQQLLILKSEPLVKNVSLSQIAIGKKGRVNFGLNLSLDPTIFK